MNEERQRRRLEQLEKRRAVMMQRMEAHQARLEQRRELMQQRMDREIERANKAFERAAATLELDGKMSPKQEKIIEAALEQLRTKGLNELSLREIAKSAHMQAPALYWHFKNKEVLIDYMAEAILQKEFKVVEPRKADQPWQEWLEEHICRLRKAMLAYTDGARVVAGAHLYPAITMARLFESSLESLCTAGFDLEEAARITSAATMYTYGFVIEEQSGPDMEEITSAHTTAFLEHFPYMAKMVKTHYVAGNLDPDADFKSGLQLIISAASKH